VTSQIPFTPLSPEAMARLEPAERLAFTTAASQVARDKNPGINTTAALVLTIHRLISEPAAPGPLLQWSGNDTPAGTKTGQAGGFTLFTITLVASEEGGEAGGAWQMTTMLPGLGTTWAADDFIALEEIAEESLAGWLHRVQGSPGADYLRAAAEAGNALIGEILEALCRRDGLSLDSEADPGEPARNYELAMRLGIGRVFGLKEDHDA